MFVCVYIYLHTNTHHVNTVQNISFYYAVDPSYNRHVYVQPLNVDIGHMRFQTLNKGIIIITYKHKCTCMLKHIHMEI